jgi:catechol 2,3-dioxygenase-like lactoylglutathione lyase family enzyme
MADPAARLLSALPAFVTPDVRGAVAWYRDLLGFHVPRGAEEAEVFAIVELAPGQGVHLKRGPAVRPDERRLGGYVRMGWDEIHRAERDFGHRGLRLESPLRDTEWGMREMVVEDPFGYQLRIGSDSDKSAAAGVVTLVPEIPVKDAVAAAAFCREVLGCREFGPSAEFPDFRMVAREGAVLHWGGGAGATPRNRPRAQIWDVYILVAGLEALAAELVGRGARVLRGPENTAYDMRELEIAGPEDSTICFGEDAG